jgi:hypothetical protein
VSLTLTVLHAVLKAAFEDELLESNPAFRDLSGFASRLATIELKLPEQA